MPYVPRALAATIRRAMRTFPAVLVTGPRQTGKTTLLREEFGASHRLPVAGSARTCASSPATIPSGSSRTRATA